MNDYNLWQAYVNMYGIPKDLGKTSTMPFAFIIDNFSKKGKTLQDMPKLDLHGRTIQSAYEMVLDWLIAARLDNVKRVLVITGKGDYEPHNPTIAHEFPHWCKTEKFKKHIHSFKHAPQNLGGTGAWVIQLKRKK